MDEAFLRFKIQCPVVIWSGVMRIRIRHILE